MDSKTPKKPSASQVKAKRIAVARAKKYFNKPVHDAKKLAGLGK